MPVRYTAEPDRGLIRTRTGDVTFAEVMDHFQDLEEDPTVPDRLDVLLDLTALTSIPTSEQLRVVAGTAGQVRARVRWGALARPRPRPGCGVQRMATPEPRITLTHRTDGRSVLRCVRADGSGTRGPLTAAPPA